MRILIADDHIAVRKGVRSILESHDGYVVCGEAANGLEAVEQVRESDPDVVVLDITMPVLNGIEAAREITQERPDIPILILSMHEYSLQSAAVMGTGIKGYVTKSKTADELIRAIEAVSSGQTYFPDGAHSGPAARDS
jgi:DNA-binding NarL/FixJ family response regulator